MVYRQERRPTIEINLRPRAEHSEPRSAKQEVDCVGTVLSGNYCNFGDRGLQGSGVDHETSEHRGIQTGYTQSFLYNWTSSHLELQQRLGYHGMAI